MPDFECRTNLAYGGRRPLAVERQPGKKRYGDDPGTNQRISAAIPVRNRTTSALMAPQVQGRPNNPARRSSRKPVARLRVFGPARFKKLEARVRLPQEQRERRDDRCGDGDEVTTRHAAAAMKWSMRSGLRGSTGAPADVAADETAQVRLVVDAGGDQPEDAHDHGVLPPV